MGKTFSTAKGDTRVCPGGTLLSRKKETGVLEPADLTGAMVRFVMMKNSTVLIDKEAINLPEKGRVVYPWQPGETDTAGVFRAWFKVTYPDGKTETHPNVGSLLISIS